MADPEGTPWQVGLLATQALALGLTTAFLIIPTSGLFLDAYGSSALPWAYIGVAAVGAGGSPMLARSLRRWTLPTVSVALLAALAGVILASWAVLTSTATNWPAALLYVLYPMTIQLGFVIVGGQAGRLLNVRQMKALFPRVVAGFPVGFLIGGLGAARLLSVFGRTEHLLPLSAGFAVVFLILVVVTRARFPMELGTPVQAAASGEPRRVPTRTLLSHPFVFALLGYQLLSMLGTQLIEFLVYDRAAARYSGSAEIARFFSSFTVALNGVDIVFLAFFAGYLVKRYGMRFGLVANSSVVTMLVLGALVVGLTSSSLSLTLFVFVCAARIGDIALTDGVTRTAINTAYQALPSQERLSAQAFVEGVGVPVAIGVTGVILLVLDGVLNVGTNALLALIVAVAVAWTAAGIVVYRRYQQALLETLRRRTLDPSVLNTDDDATLAVVDRLIDSDDERDARLGLEVLSGHPALAPRLEAMTAARFPSVRAEALRQLARTDPDAATRRARVATTDPAADVRTTAVRILAAGQGPDDLALVERAAADGSPTVGLTALAMLAAGGDHHATTRFEEAISAAVTSGDVEARLAAVAALGATPGPNTSLLRRLLTDDDPSVAAAACSAAVETGDPDLLAAVAANLADGTRASGAAEALRRAGSGMAAIVDDRLSARDRWSDTTLVRLVRCCRDLPADDAAALVSNHASHPSREVGLTVLSVLGPLLPTGDTGVSLAADAVLRRDATHAARVLHALTLVDDEPRADLLRAALTDELTLLQARVAAALSLHHDPAVIEQAVRWLLSERANDAALALETLDVALTPTEKALALPVLLARGGLQQRHEEFTRHIGIPTPTLDQLLTDIVADHDEQWQRPWLKACALQLAVVVGVQDLDRLIAEAATADPDHPDGVVVVETAVWAASAGGTMHADRRPNRGR